MANKIQLTLALFKPDLTVNEKSVQLVREIIRQNGFYFIKSKNTKLSLDQAKQFYKAHEKKFFYNRLTYSMSSGPIWCHILGRRENAIEYWRKLMGSTKVFKTIYEDPNSIRGRFGTTDTRNATHGSDSVENAREEIKFFFPEFDIDKWYAENERYFLENKIKFDENLIEHVSVK